MKTVKYLIMKDGRAEITTSYKEATAADVKLIDTIFDEHANVNSLSKAEKRAMGLIK